MKNNHLRLLALLLCVCTLLCFAACGEKAPSKTNDDITPPENEDTKEPSAEDKTPSKPTEPEKPVEPEQPTDPEQPVEPENPTEPDEPTVPTEPENPTEPEQPTQPSEPDLPTEPDVPSQPETPVQPDEPTTPSEPEKPTEPENYDGLEPWKVAYLKFLDDDVKYNSDRCTYSLVFVDSDNIPELFVCGPDSASGERLCSYKNGQLVCEQLRRTGGSRYIPATGLVYNHQGNMDHYSTNVYHLTDSGFVNLFHGTNENRRYQTLDTNGEVTIKAVTLYYIDGKEVTEEEHDAEVAKHFDYSKSKSFFRDGPVVGVDYATVRQQIKDWDYSILPPTPPAEPEKPTQPEKPAEPDTPTSPSDIVTPPTKPETPSTPTSPSDIVPPPAKPTEPDVPTEPDLPEYPDISNDPVVLAGGIPQTVYDAINQGDLEKAYAMLYSIKTPSEKQKELMSHFVFLPKETFEDGYIRTEISIYKYDEQGNIKFIKYCNLDRSVNEYFYNADGTLQTVTYYAPYGPWDDFTYVYNKKGQMVLCVYEDNSGNRYNVNYSYDENGNILSWKSPYEECTYTYDEKGNLITEDYFNSGSRPERRLYSYTYDSKNRLLTKTAKLSDTTSITTYEYNANGFLIKLEETRDGQVTHTISYTWDEKGNVLSESIEQNGNTIKTEYTYNEKGNILAETIKQNGQTSKTEYTYDDYGNMLTKKNRSKYVDYSYTYELHYFPSALPTNPEHYISY